MMPVLNTVEMVEVRICSERGCDMDAQYVSGYRELYTRHWWWRSRERAVLGAIEEFHRPGPNDRVLDIGCGDGLFFDELSKFGRVEGIEANAAALSASGRHRRRIHVARIEQVERGLSNYRLITMLDVLEHIDDEKAAVKSVRSLLAQDGRVVLTVPAFQWLWTGHDTVNHHYRRYTANRLRSLFESAGFEVECVRYLFHWVGCAKLLVKCKELILGEDLSGPRVPRDSINWILKKVSLAELRKGRGLGVPFGSSLLAILKHADISGKSVQADREA